jgi:hypothetical protein
VIDRRPLRSKIKAETTSRAADSATVQRLSLFGPRLLLEGEDVAAYDEFRGRVCAAVKPLDVFEAIFLDDYVASQWDVLRWRRIKYGFIRAIELVELETVLRKNLGCELYTENLVDRLAEVLQDNRAKNDPEDFAEPLAREYVRNARAAVDKVDKILTGRNLGLYEIHERARNDKARELARAYARSEPRAVKLIGELLVRVGVSIDGLRAAAAVKKLDDIERFDRQITIAESRRDASLHELDRHRAGLGEKLRRSVQDVVDAKFEVIETIPAKEKKQLDERAKDRG